MIPLRNIKTWFLLKKGLMQLLIPYIFIIQLQDAMLQYVRPTLQIMCLLTNKRKQIGLTKIDNM